jgi:putative transposase
MPIGLAVDGANRNDFRLVEETLDSIPVERPEATRRVPQGLCLDKGYDYAEVRSHALDHGYTPHIRCRGEEARLLRENSRRKARRWVVERTHSWLNKYRSILIRWAKKWANYLGLLHFACAILTYRRMGVLG